MIRRESFSPIPRIQELFVGCNVHAAGMVGKHIVILEYKRLMLGRTIYFGTLYEPYGGWAELDPGYHETEFTFCLKHGASIRGSILPRRVPVDDTVIAMIRALAEQEGPAEDIQSQQNAERAIERAKYLDAERRKGERYLLRKGWSIR